MRKREEHGLLAELGGRHLRFVAHDVERRRHDLALLLRQLVHLVASATAATTTAGHRLCRLVVLLEGANLHEVDVARGRLRTRHGVVVHRLRVVGHEIARLEPEFLEVEGVACRHLGQCLRTAEQMNGLLGAAIHRVEHLHLLDAVVVVGLHLGEHFFNRAGVRVATWLVEAHRWSLIVEHVDRVLRRRVDLFTRRSDQLDLVEAFVLHGEVGGEGAVGLFRERERFVLVEDHAATGRRHSRRDLQADIGTLDGRNVAAWFDRSWLQPCIGREAVLHCQLVDRRQIDNVHLEGGRANAVRLDVVVGGLLDVEKHTFKMSGFSRGHQRDALEASSGVRAEHQRRFGIGEAQKCRLHVLIHAARKLGVARRDFNLVGAGRLRAPRDDEEGRHAAAQEGRAERNEQGGGYGNAAEQIALLSQASALDRQTVFERVALLDCLVHEPIDQHGRRSVIAALDGRDRFDGAQNRGLEGRVFFFEVKGDLSVRDAPTQRLHEADDDERGKYQERDQAERDDCGWRKTKRFEARRRQEQREQRARDHDDRSSERELQPPAVSDAMNDSDELLTTIGATRSISHRRPSYRVP